MTQILTSPKSQKLNQKTNAAPGQAATLPHDVQLVALNAVNFLPPLQHVLQQVVQAMNFIDANEARMEFNEKMEKLARRQQLVGLPHPSGDSTNQESNPERNSCRIGTNLWDHRLNMWVHSSFTLVFHPTSHKYALPRGGETTTAHLG